MHYPQAPPLIKWELIHQFNDCPRITRISTNILHNRADLQPLCVKSCNTLIIKELKGSEKIIKSIKT